MRTPYEFPAIHSVTRDGRRTERLTSRYLGSTLGLNSQIVVFDQQDFQRDVALFSDLYVFDRTTGRTDPLTSGARLIDPDVAPDGRSIVCVREGSGQRDLVLLSLETIPGSRSTAGNILSLVSEAGTQFNTPRWSPDGRTIVVERHRLGALSEIVVVDVESRAVHPVASSASARVVTPTWRPDGRAVIAAADFDGTFNLYEFAFGDGGFQSANVRKLTFLPGGARWPDVSRDGRTIVFAGYTSDGFDIFTVRYPASSPTSSQAPALPAVLTPSPDLPTRPPLVPTTAIPTTYAPWATLKPTSWTPILGSGGGLRLGAATSGYDVLQYHWYRAEATWIVTSDDENPPVERRGVPDWNLTYAYQRFRPTLFVAASNSTSFLAGPTSAAGEPTRGTVRERAFEAGIQFPFRRVRFSHQGVATIRREANDYTLPDGSGLHVERALRFGWAATSAERYGYSISPEHGFTAGATVERAGFGPGGVGDATTLTADARAYLPGLGRNHVVAVRASGGVSTGQDDARRVFHLGGAASATSVLDFGRGAFSLLRGFPSDSFAGHRVMVGNIDYRWPFIRPQRGVGTWPLFLHTVHAALFADAGHTWTDTFRARDVKTSVGGELSFDLVMGYAYPVTLTFGAAAGRDGSHSLPDGTQLYVRVGAAF